jgi:DNA repair ATPase RecN
MIPSRLEELETELRAAAASRRYAETARLAAEFCKAQRAYAQTLPKADPRRAEAARKLDDILSWALLMLKMARATCAAELRRVTTAGRYAGACRQPGQTTGVRLDG